MQIVALMLNGWKLLTERKGDPYISFKFQVSLSILNIKFSLFNSRRYLLAESFSQYTLVLFLLFYFFSFLLSDQKIVKKNSQYTLDFDKKRSRNWLVTTPGKLSEIHLHKWLFTNPCGNVLIVVGISWSPDLRVERR